MSEVIKRDKRVQVLAKLYGVIKADSDKASSAMVEAWRAQVEKAWAAFEEAHDVVLDRAGSSEMTEQHKVFDDAYSMQYKANVLIEESSSRCKNVKASLGVPKDDQLTPLQRQHTYQTQVFQAACQRIIQTAEDIYNDEVQLEQANVNELHASLHQLTSEMVALGVDNAELIAAEEAAFILHRAATRALREAHPPQNIVPAGIPQRDPPADADALRMPQLSIAPFDGTSEKWEAFRESFEHGIDARVNMPAVQKLQYLKSVLRGEPEELVRNFRLTEANYDAAWTLLKRNYNNNRELIVAHIRTLTSFPACSESADELRSMANKASSAILALTNLGRATDQWDDWIVFHITEKLDCETRRMWEQSLDVAAIPTWNQLDLFLQGRIRALACVSVSSSAKHGSSQKAKPTKIRAHQTSKGVPQPAQQPPRGDEQHQVCPVCGEVHLITFCNQFRSMSAPDRRRMAADKSLCFICLLAGHQARACQDVRRRCSHCDQKHNSLLHDPDAPTRASQQQQPAVQAHTSSAMSGQRTRVLLATAIVNVRDNGGEIRQMRALLDQGAEASFISENAAQTLQLPRSNERVEVEGLGGVNAGRSTQSMVICVSDRFGSGYSVDVAALVIPRINNQGGERVMNSNQCPARLWPHTSDLEMADPEFMQLHPIDILLGGEVYGKLLMSGVRQHAGLPTAQNTHLGWILSGPMQQPQHVSTKASHVIVSHHTSVDDQLARFWQLEEITTKRQRTIDEEACDKFFDETVVRDSCGRIHVRLPMRNDTVDFGESQRFAVQRQLQIERRFEKAPDFAERYRDFMAQYIELGHMHEVIGASVDMTLRQKMSVARREYYIPHHAVTKEASSTTKLRVVFDASRRTTSGLCLNDEMFVGPRLQDDLTAIMMRWRKVRVAFTADIEKMYRQFAVDAPDKDLQRIVWRATSSEAMKVYQLATVTYGTASAPYLAIKSLQTLAVLESERYPIASNVVLNNFYVDDALGGADTVAECVEMQQQLLQLLSSGGLQLRKWASNSEEILGRINPAHRECQLPLDIHDGHQISTLGIQWNPVSDEMGFKIDTQANTSETNTKRTFLSAASRLYDPLGWVAPAIIVVKMMFQSLWKLQLDWDDALPSDFAKQWDEIHASLQQLQHVKIKRWINTTRDCDVELHGFCDASINAYGAVVYARVMNADHTTTTHILCAKTRVAPIKVVSLPRLELCGAALLTDLMVNVRIAMQWPAVKMHCWTDSTIVLAWLRGDPARFNVFVANRTADIQRKIPAQHWRHVGTADNPADCASRGISVNQLLHKTLWWTGPTWLAKPSTEWPHQTTVPDATDELRVRVNIAVEPERGWELINQISSWCRLIRVTSWCKRFATNCRTRPETRQVGVLTTAEIVSAREFWVRQAQRFVYRDELRCLRKNQQLSKSSPLRPLNPFVCSDDLLRVGGRLSNAHGMTSAARNPAIVPRRSALSAHLMRDAHQQTMHGGPSLMMAYLRRAYWVIDGPNEARRFVQRCTTCFREVARPRQQLMAALPAARVSPSRPFLHCAMDYSGAIMVRSTRGRGHHATKAYIAVFVCLATKAVHLELVSDLTTTGFIAAYERFVSRRGRCTDLYSDNATNFVGAAATFVRSERALFGDQLRSTLATSGTNWHFAPPLSPHFNGLAESAIRAVKYHIRRVVGESTLTFEEFVTVLTKVEACLNSRPLHPMSSDPDDYDVLTPGHFLIGEPLTTIPQRDVLETKTSTLTRWQLTHQIVQRIWKRWSADYLHTLQQRRKWQTASDNVKIGDLVLILEDNLPPAKWALGRVIEAHPGDDGRVRVVTIKARGSTFKRSIVKVAKLPVENEMTSDNSDV